MASGCRNFGGRSRANAAFRQGRPPQSRGFLLLCRQVPSHGRFQFWENPNRTNLDFGHLKALASLDSDLRYTLLPLTLDVEHPARTKLEQIATLMYLHTQLAPWPDYGLIMSSPAKCHEWLPPMPDGSEQAAKTNHCAFSPTNVESRL